MTCAWLFALVLTSAGVPAPTGVDAEAEAKRLVAEGARLAELGRYDEAIAIFRNAEAMRPRADHDCNIGLAYARSDRNAEAWYFLRRCRVRSVDPLPGWVEMRLQTVLAGLEAGRFAPVDLSAEPAGSTATIATFLPDDLLQVRGRIWLPLGDHELVATSPGGAVEKRPLHLESKAPLPLHLTLGPARPPDVRGTVALAVGAGVSGWSRVCTGKVPGSQTERSWAWVQGAALAVVGVDVARVPWSASLVLSTRTFGESTVQPSDGTESDARTFVNDTLSGARLVGSYYALRRPGRSISVGAGLSGEWYGSADPDLLPSYSTIAVDLETGGDFALGGFVVSPKIGAGLLLSRNEPPVIGRTPTSSPNITLRLDGTWPREGRLAVRGGYVFESRNVQYTDVSQVPGGFELEDAYMAESLHTLSISMVRRF